MPSYQYKCVNTDCESRFTKSLPISCRNDAQVCPTCQSASVKMVAEGVGGVLRGDVWVGKNIQVKNQMHERRRKVGEREKVLGKEGPQFKLAPNVAGERVDTWREASKLASSLGKDTSGYNARAQQEGTR